MTVTGSKWDDAKDAILADAAKVAEHSRSAGALPPDQVERLLAIYYRHVSVEDLLHRDPVDVYGAARSHYRLAQERPQGTAAVNVFTPTVEEHGWSCSHTVVEVVTDDMPFLVDSVTMELTGASTASTSSCTRRSPCAARSPAGCSASRAARTARDGGRRRDLDLVPESWIHVEIDRVSDPGDLAQIEADLRRVLNDVRESVEDWRQDAGPRTGGGGGPRRPTRHRCPSRRSPTAASCSLAGRQPLHVPRLPRVHPARDTGRRRACAPYPATGLASCARTARSTRRSPAAAAGAHQGDGEAAPRSSPRPTPAPRCTGRPTSTTSGSRRFDETGEVVGERRFLGLFTSAAYTQSVRRIPVLRAQGRPGDRALRLPPTRHSGKVLLDILETYPRDELFQIVGGGALPTAMAVLHLQERRRLRLFVRRDAYGRYVSCMVYLPRDRYTTDVRLSACRLLLSRAAAAATIDYSAAGQRVGAGPAALRRPAAARRARSADVDVAALEAQLAEATRTWADDFADALVEQAARRRGARLLAPLRRRVPGGLQGGLPARTGVADLLRLEELAGRRGPSALSLVRAGRRRAERAPAQDLPHGQPLSLSDVLPRARTDGRRGRRRASVRDRDRADGPAWIYDFGLRYDAGDRAAEPPRPGAVPGRVRCRVARPGRERRLQRAGAARPG